MGFTFSLYSAPNPLVLNAAPGNNPIQIVNSTTGNVVGYLRVDGVGDGNLTLKDSNGIDRFILNNSNGFLIGTSTGSSSAIIKIESTSRGLLFPRMTTAQKNAIGSPVSGLVVYDSTLNKLCVYGAAGWETVTSV